MPQIVDPAERRNPGRDLSGFPIAGAEVVQVEAAAADRGKEERLSICGKSVERGERNRFQGTARTRSTHLGGDRSPRRRVRPIACTR
jgi:hypothetical protein